MIRPRAALPYSAARASSSRPRPVDCCAGWTTSSESPHRPSRRMAMAAPTTRPLRWATQQPPGSVASGWSIRTRARSGGWAGGSGTPLAASRPANAAWVT